MVEVQRVAGDVVRSRQVLTKEATDEGIGFGEGLRETFEQLDELLVTLGASR